MFQCIVPCEKFNLTKPNSTFKRVWFFILLFFFASDIYSQSNNPVRSPLDTCVVYFDHHGDHLICQKSIRTNSVLIQEDKMGFSSIQELIVTDGMNNIVNIEKDNSYLPFMKKYLRKNRVLRIICHDESILIVTLKTDQ